VGNENRAEKERGINKGGGKSVKGGDRSEQHEKMAFLNA